jgi:hypothetical protein
MGRKKRRAERPAPQASIPELDQPIQAGEAVVVAWMLTAATTLAAELGFGGVAVAGLAVPAGQRLAMLEALLGFACVVLGAFTLVLTAVARSMRRGPPPRGVTLAAIAVGSAPLVALIARLAHSALRPG